MPARRRLVTLLAVLCLCLCALSQPAHAQHTASPPQINRPTSTPYTGPLGVFDANKNRDRDLQIGRVMDLLGITPGRSVADIGAGSGWFTERAARRVGRSGTVYAEDINPVAIQTIDERVAKAHLGNVHTVHGTPDDPKLPPQSVDAVLMLQVYHEIAHPELFLRNLQAALRPGAKFGIIDRNGTGADHGLNEPVLVKELAEAGFRRVGSYDFTKAAGQDYFVIFERK